jgi:hypothetical protein
MPSRITSLAKMPGLVGVSWTTRVRRTWQERPDRDGLVDLERQSDPPREPLLAWTLFCRAWVSPRTAPRLSGRRQHLQSHIGRSPAGPGR